jgi:hypothetical protein
MDDTFGASALIPTGVDGGPGDDSLRGGPAMDYLFGSAGNDVLDGGLGADMMSGGDGRDLADYSGRSASVSVIPDNGWNDGQAGELDFVSSSVEDVAGGSGDDRLGGTAAANQLFGGAGSDSITGGDGDDALDGGPGHDTFSADAGNDIVRARDAENDSVACGAGTDAVESDTADSLAGDCERASTEPITGGNPTLERMPRYARLSRGGFVRIKISCPASAVGGCSGRITVDVLGGARASAAAASARSRGKRFSLKAGETKTTKVKISRNGRRRVLKKKRAKCRVSVHARSAGGRQVTVRKKIVVKAPTGR